jgi:putative membrane protein
MMYDQFDHSGVGAGGWFFMLLMMVLVILGIVAFIHYLSNANRQTSSSDSSLETLKNRYAKGEIDKKEFDQKRKDLKA